MTFRIQYHHKRQEFLSHCQKLLTEVTLEWVAILWRFSSWGSSGPGWWSIQMTCRQLKVMPKTVGRQTVPHSLARYGKPECTTDNLTWETNNQLKLNELNLPIHFPIQANYQLHVICIRLAQYCLNEDVQEYEILFCNVLKQTRNGTFAALIMWVIKKNHPVNSCPPENVRFLISKAFTVQLSN